MAPSALPGSESAPSPLAAAASGGAGPIAPEACHKWSNGSAPRLTIAAPGNAPSRSGSSTKPSATGTLPIACASSLSPSGKLSASVPISAWPGTQCIDGRTIYVDNHHFQARCHGPTQRLVAGEHEVEGAVAQRLAHGLRK